MNHLPEGLDARRTPAATADRMLKLALVTLIVGGLAAHAWVWVALVK